MPAYHNIETYFSLERRTHADAVNLYADALRAITAPTDAREVWLATVAHETALHEGCASSGPGLVADSGTTGLDVRPLIHPAVRPGTGCPRTFRGPARADGSTCPAGTPGSRDGWPRFRTR